MGWLIVIGIILVIWFIVWLSNRLSNLRAMAKKYVELKPRLDNLDNYNRKLESKDSQLKEREVAINTLVKEKSQGFPWLVKVYDDYFSLQDSNLANKLITKPHPALRAAETVRQIAKERREAEKAARLANYLLDYSGKMPWVRALCQILSGGCYLREEKGTLLHRP